MKRFSLLIAVFACLAGCGKSGPPLSPVSGTVTLDGAPLTEGVVSFVSKSGYASSATLNAEGRFKLVSHFGEGIPRGEYRVTLQPLPLDPSLMSMTQATLPARKFPAKYEYPDRSGLTASVAEHSHEFGFQLTRN